MSNLLNISAMVVLFDLGLDAQDFINKLFPNGWEPLVVQLLAFGVLVLAGVFLAYKPVKKLLNERASYVEKNIKEAEEKNIGGKEVTPFLLDKVKTITAGKSLASNIELVYNNAKVAAQIAKDLADLNK